MLTHVYADVAVPASDAPLLRALLQAEKGLERAGASAGSGYDRLIALCADGQVYRILACEGEAQIRAIYQVLAWFGCKKVEADDLRLGIDDLFEMPPLTGSPLRADGRPRQSAPAAR